MKIRKRQNDLGGVGKRALSCVKASEKEEQNLRCRAMGTNKA